MVPDDADAGALELSSELAWQSWRFWDGGLRLYVLSESAAARLTANAYDAGAWAFAAPPASYVQLPYQRVWARVADDAAYEPVDGWFVGARAHGAAAHELSLLAVLGLRRDRPGISLLPHRAVLSDAEILARIAHPWREGAAPFANAIPGGELKGYQTLATSSELEALALRTLHTLDTGSRTLHNAQGSGAVGETTLPYVDVP